MRPPGVTDKGPQVAVAVDVVQLGTSVAAPGQPDDGRIHRTKRPHPSMPLCDTTRPHPENSPTTRIRQAIAVSKKIAKGALVKYGQHR